MVKTLSRQTDLHVLHGMKGDETAIKNPVLQFVSSK